jgi:hypothetical protein
LQRLRASCFARIGGGDRAGSEECKEISIQDRRESASKVDLPLW